METRKLIFFAKFGVRWEMEVCEYEKVDRKVKSILVENILLKRAKREWKKIFIKDGFKKEMLLEKCSTKVYDV